MILERRDLGLKAAAVEGEATKDVEEDEEEVEEDGSTVALLEAAAAVSASWMRRGRSMRW